MADFAAQLKKLSAHCEFGTFLDEALRDRFVCGLRKEPIQRKLLGEKTFRERAADCTVDGNGGKKVFGTEGLGIFRNVKN